MKKILTILAILIIISFNTVKIGAEKLNISEECSYILIDAKNGQVIAEQKADEKLRPASTTKIMTAIIALENRKLDSLMNVSKSAVYDIGEGGMHVGILPGESNLTLEHLLNVTLIKSANEAANIIAENISGSKEEFVKKMNERAIQLGALNTNFVNPCGKDDAKADKDHLSTARDMAIIARHAMTMPKFREIVCKEWYGELPATNIHEKWGRFRTTNRLLWNEDHKYTYEFNNIENKYLVNGLKTGYTSKAGNNFLCSAVNENGMELIAAVMHVNKGNNSVFNYAKELLEYGFKQYSNQKLIEGNQIIRTVTVENAKNNESLDLKARNDFICALPFDKSKWNVTSKENISLPIEAPVSQGEVLGYIEYERNGIKLGKVEIVAGNSIEKKASILDDIDTSDKGMNLGMIIIISIIAALLFFVPRIIINKIRDKSI